MPSIIGRMRCYVIEGRRKGISLKAHWKNSKRFAGRDPRAGIEAIHHTPPDDDFGQ
jgi:hypothetical protein